MKRLLAALLLAASAAPALAQSPGDWVLGRWRGGDYWFPGVVRAVTPGTIAIDYDDGDREVLPRDLVRRYDWAVGTRVQCNYQGAGTWYEGRIAGMQGATIDVLYDDGDRERTTTGRCRSQ